MPSSPQWLLWLPVAGILPVVAALLARLVARGSLTVPLRERIQALQDYRTTLSGAPAHDAERTQIDREIARLSRMLTGRQQRKHLRDARWRLHFAVLLVAWVAPLTCGLFITDAPLGQCLVLSTVLTVLWYLASIDIDHGYINDRTVLGLGLFLVWMTLASPLLAWTHPTMAMLGMALVVTLIQIAILAVQCQRRRRGQPQAAPPAQLFGQGDTLVLIALSLYFGMDILTILLLACLITLPLAWQAPRIQRWLLRQGHYPMRMGRQLPFLPAIFIGTLLTWVVQQATAFSFNPVTESIARHLSLWAVA